MVIVISQWDWATVTSFLVNRPNRKDQTVNSVNPFGHFGPQTAGKQETDSGKSLTFFRASSWHFRSLFFPVMYLDPLNVLRNDEDIVNIIQERIVNINISLFLALGGFRYISDGSRFRQASNLRISTLKARLGWKPTMVEEKSPKI